MTRTPIITVGLISLIAPLSAAGAAEAGCTQSIYSPGGTTCIGTNTLSVDAGFLNTALGDQALMWNTTGNYNTATGGAAMFSNTIGSFNAATGTFALYYNTTGSSNTASGSGAMSYNTTGGNNTANGTNALRANTSGKSNTALGSEALKNNTTGGNNIAIGARAGFNWTTGNNNIAIGNPGLVSDGRSIRIGLQGTQIKTFVAGIRGINVTGGQAVVVSSTGQLGVVSSSRRYKQDIQPMGDASDALMQLRPVTFRYKQPEADGSQPLQYGLIAEEVAETMPGLAIYNDEGQPESVAYQLLPSLLLNEYQKQGHALAATQTRLAETQQKLAALEGEMAAMKLMLQRLASAQTGTTKLAAAP